MLKEQRKGEQNERCVPGNRYNELKRERLEMKIWKFSKFKNTFNGITGIVRKGIL